MRSMVVGLGIFVVAGVPVACGGVTVDQRASGSAGAGGVRSGYGGAAGFNAAAGSNVSGSSSAMAGSAGATPPPPPPPGQCTTTDDCGLRNAPDVVCPDGTHSHPYTPTCVAGRCQFTNPDPCNVGDAAVVNTGGSPGTTSIRFSVTGPASYCTRCDGPILEIEDSMGAPLDIGGNGCRLDCSTCSQPGPCWAVPACVPEVETMLAFEWDGGYYASSYCGMSLPCAQKTFAKPGKYRAKFCAAPGTLTKMNGVSQCSPSGPAQCSTVDFDYPSSTTVTGSVGEAADGG